LAGQVGEVAAEAVEGRRLALARLLRGGRSPLTRLRSLEPVAQQVQDLFADVFELHSQVHQHLGGDPFLLPKQA